MAEACRSSPQNTYEVDTLVAELAADEWGVLSLEELRECGLSANAVASRVRRGRFHRKHRGVYAIGHANLTLRGQFLAAVKACGPGAVLSHVSAAALWDLVAWDGGRLPEVTVPGTAARRVPGVLVHRTRNEPRAIRYDRILVTTPARALIDVASVLAFDPLRRAVREAMARKRVTIRELIETDGYKRASLNRILADGYTPTRTELEDAVLAVMGGFARPAINPRLTIHGIPTVPDFLRPEQRLVVEADGRQWHDHPLAREDDAERQARLEAAGYRVVRVTWRQAVGDPAQTVARLTAAGAPASTGVMLG